MLVEPSRAQKSYSCNGSEFCMAPVIFSSHYLPLSFKLHFIPMTRATLSPQNSPIDHNLDMFISHKYIFGYSLIPLFCSHYITTLLSVSVLVILDWISEPTQVYSGLLELFSAPPTISPPVLTTPCPADWLPLLRSQLPLIPFLAFASLLAPWGKLHFCHSLSLLGI